MDGNGMTIHNENTNCNVFNAPVYNAIILPPGCQPPQAPSPAQPSRTRKLLEAGAEEVRTEAPEAPIPSWKRSGGRPCGVHWPH